MPVSTKVDVEKNLIIHHFSESVSLQTILQTVKNTIAHPEFRAGMDAIWVCDDNTKVDMSSEDTLKVSEYARKEFGKLGTHYKVALVANDDLAYGMNRVYEGWSNDRPISINTFRKIEDALIWIQKEDE